jgi:macrolide transport system ATP-binding/permease protein
LPESIIKVEDLHFSHYLGGTETPILKGVSFEVAKGDMIAIQGPSGSGKSTLFYLLGCMQRQKSGRILICDTNIAELNESSLAYFRNQRIGFIFQQFHLLSRATVLQNILLPASYPAELPKDHKQSHSRALELADRLGLTEHQSKEPNQLSGGQQQRVAIARALMHDVDLILADEPTGNLDSQSAEQVMALFKQLNMQGKTIVIITHNDEIARQCQKVLHFRDGQMTQISTPQNTCPLPDAPASGPPISYPVQVATTNAQHRGNSFRVFTSSVPIVLANILRNRVKSLLTMMGVTIGIAAVLAMISLGQLTKHKILEGYEALGVNKLTVSGYRNWRLKPGEFLGGNPFQGFTWEGNLVPLVKLFPEIRRISPRGSSWVKEISYGGKSNKEDQLMLGVGSDYLGIINGHMAHGRFISGIDIERADKVCVIGSAIAKAFGVPAAELVDQIIVVKLQTSSMPCRVIGVMAKQSSSQDETGPDSQVMLGFTTFAMVVASWDRHFSGFVLSTSEPESVVDLGIKITKYLEARYGKSGIFSVEGNSALIAQMRRFLGIFSILLAGIAFLSLLVGGIGIHNMMLVSVADRLKEIGLRKALGATSHSIRILFLSEALVLCVLAGIIGIGLGFAATQLGVYAGSIMVKGFKFEWYFEWTALLIAGTSMLLVGIISGLAPARKAEKLSVIEALRSE